MAFLQVQSQAAYSLAGSGAVAGATSITLKSFESIDGVPLTMAMFGTIGYGTLEPGNGAQEEQISFTGVSQNANGTATLSGVKTVLFVSPYTETSGLSKTHPGSSSFVISNTAGFYEQFGHLANDEVIAGFWEAPDPITAQGLVTRDWILALINGGAISTDSIIVTGTAGETLVAGNLVYLKSSDGRWWKTDADTAATVENVTLGISQGAGTAGNSITGGVLTVGIDSNQSGLTPNTIYYASNTAGGISSSAGTKEVTVGIALSATELAFFPRFNQMPTEDELDAMSGGGDLGTPSATNKFLTEDSIGNTTLFPNPIVRVYGLGATLGSSSTQFDITNPAGTTFRYTYDGTGTDPVINSTTFPVGATVMIKLNDYNSAAIVNSGSFTVTGSGANYFEVTNASGSAQSNITIGSVGFLRVATNEAWSKPAGLKYAVVEVVGGGGGAGGTTTGSECTAGGGGGGYARETIAAASLGATETVTVGGGGRGGLHTGGTGITGGTSSFGSHVSATGGAGGTKDGNGGAGGVGSGGDVNSTGSGGGIGQATGTQPGNGGDSYFGGGAPAASNATNNNGGNYGGGGGGIVGSGGDEGGSFGGSGVVVVTEYYF